MSGFIVKYFSCRRQAARFMALVLACTYFGFRTEIFGEEFEANSIRHVKDIGGILLSVPSTNWETYDKDNASKAFRINPILPPVLLASLPEESLPHAIVPEQTAIIRDKSPPSLH